MNKEIINEEVTYAISKLKLNIPEIWTESIIKPIYKQKGDRNNPDNYRGICLISCFSKLFTAVLNNRLEKFIEVNQIIGEEQAGFRHGYSTLDNIYKQASNLRKPKKY